MLIEFSVENFLSIKDEITLSMVASKDKSLDFNITKFDKINLLKSAAIYGPNASGKTNILRALQYVAFLIINSHKTQSGEAIEFKPFKLNKACETMPSSFKIVFETGGIKYDYSLSLDRDVIHKEKLCYYPPPHGKRRIIFERDLNSPSNTYRFPQDEKRQNVIKENTRDNMLYLSRSANMNYEKTSVVVDWFAKNFRAVFPEGFISTFQLYTKAIFASNDSKKEQIRNLVSKADSGIIGIEVKDRELGDDFLKEFPKEVRELLQEDARQEVETTHVGLDDKGDNMKVQFKLSEESKGTQKMFNLAGPFADALSDGRLLIVDEIETSLHPLLVRYLVDAFNNPEYNKNGAQLIFATHTPFLLHPNILRRDQIWFTEKRLDQSTELRSLYEYKARKDENIEKGYLAGRYGAIPNLD